MEGLSLANVCWIDGYDGQRELGMDEMRFKIFNMLNFKYNKVIFFPFDTIQILTA